MRDTHPADRLHDMGLRDDGGGRWIGVLNDREIRVSVDRINRGAVDEEPLWQAAVSMTGDFGARKRHLLGQRFPTEAAAVAAAADWVEAQRGDPGNMRGFF
jgi:hypothetical protein